MLKTAICGAGGLGRSHAMNFAQVSGAEVALIFDVVPDAGASTVSLAVAPVEGSVPSIEAVRDAWIAELNGLDWSQL